MIVYQLEVLRKGRHNGRRGRWYWRLKSYQGRILAHSETYSNKGLAVKTANRVFDQLRSNQRAVSLVVETRDGTAMEWQRIK